MRILRQRINLTGQILLIIVFMRVSTLFNLPDTLLNPSTLNSWGDFTQRYPGSSSSLIQVNLIPVIAKADTLTDDEVIAFKKRVCPRGMWVDIRYWVILNIIKFKFLNPHAMNSMTMKPFPKTEKSCQKCHLQSSEVILPSKLVMEESSGQENIPGV